MEIKPNMYIRFFDGTIGKVADYFYDENCVNGHTILLEGRDYWSCCEKGQFEASYNLIDLIKIGDYVNGERINFISKKGQLLNDGGYDVLKKYKSITSIVTKEMFDSIKYEVK